MSQIARQDLDHGVVRLSLASGSGNPLTPRLLEELQASLAGLNHHPPRALVVDGGAGKIFSGGFDLPTIAGWDRPQLTEFFERFIDIMERMMRLPAPVVCAVHSHAVAGGFILSLAADLRIVQRGPLKLGLSEVDLGVAVPSGTQFLLAWRTSEQVARRMSMTAQLIDAEEARRVGYADELSDDAQARAVELATVLARKPGGGVADTKRLRREELVDRFLTVESQGQPAFLDSWFSPEGQACLQGLAAKLSASR